MLKIEIRTGNAAFQSNDENATQWEHDYHRNEEIKRVLKNVVNQIENGHTSGSCMDINGNKVGTWSLD